MRLSQLVLLFGASLGITLAPKTDVLAQTAGVQVLPEAVEQIDPSSGGDQTCSLETSTIEPLDIEGFDEFQTSTKAVLAALDYCIPGGLYTEGNDYTVQYADGAFYLTSQSETEDTVLRAEVEVSDGGTTVTDLFLGFRSEVFPYLVSKNGLGTAELAQSVETVRSLFSETADPVQFMNTASIPENDLLFIEGYLLGFEAIGTPWTITEHTPTGGAFGFQLEVQSDEDYVILTSREDTDVEVTFLDQPIY